MTKLTDDKDRQPTDILPQRTEVLSPASHEPTESFDGAAQGSGVAGDQAPPIDEPSADLPVVDRKHYKILGEFARGGLGRILRARDQRTGRVVAIKEIIGRSDIVAKRFAREALITANLMHPAIVPVYELGRWNTGEPFFAMKLVTGRSLREVMHAAKTLDERLACLPLLVSVAEALAYAHDKRIIHRDLKPANVLIGDFGETVVIDWGLAKTIGEADPEADDGFVADAAAIDPTVAGTILGTPLYMSPEQASAGAVDERSDVYAIGAMLYHLIAGHAPYAERKIKNSRELVAVVSTVPPVPLGIREPGAPQDLLAIVYKAMARDPDKRYATARELSEDLRRFTTGQLVGAHHYDRRTLFARWLKRHRAPVTVGAVLAVLLAVVAIVSVHRVLAERDNASQQRDIAVQQTARAETDLALALYDKGRVAEDAQQWSRAAMYYAASRHHHDTPAATWAAGLAEARSVFPAVRYTGHDAWVHAVAIAPAGDRVATVDDRGELRVWSPSDGKTIAAIKASDRPLYAIAFSPDGNELAVAGDRGEIQRRRADLSVIGTLAHHVGRVWTLAYSPDGHTLASGGEDSSVLLWSLDRTDPPRVLSGHTQRVYSVAFSPDGTQLASGSDDRRVWLWDVATGKGAVRGEHMAGGIRVVAFAGESIVTTGWDHEIRVWKPGQTTPDAWSDSHIVHGAALAPGGRVFVTGGELEAIHVWDLATHKMITSLDAPGGQTSAIAFSRDGHWLVTAGKTPPIAWDATALTRLVGFGHHAAVGSLSYNPDASHLVSSANDHTIRVWNAATGAELRRFSTAAGCGDGAIALGADEVIAACDDNMLRRWDAAGHERDLHTDVWLRLGAISPDGTTLAVGHTRGRLALVDLASWTVTTEKTAHGHHIFGVQYTPSGRLVTSGLDDFVRIWRGPDLTLDFELRVGADDGELDAAVSPDGAQIAAATDVGIDVWDTHASAWIAHARIGSVWKLQFARDGAHAVSASDDGAVRIWDPRTWRDPVVLDAGEGPALALAITPDSRTVAAGYQSGAIAMWDLASHRLVRRIGGRTRDRGSCAEIDTETWADAPHRSIVAAACATEPDRYLKELAARTHQRVDGEVDVTWDWLARAQR